MSLARLFLSQKNAVTAVGIIEEKVGNLNSWISPIDCLEKYFVEIKKERNSLILTQ